MPMILLAAGIVDISPVNRTPPPSNRRASPRSIIASTFPINFRKEQIMAKAKEASQQSNERPTNERDSGLARRESTGGLSRSTSPFSMMNRFADEMDRLFDNFGFGRGWLSSQGFGRGFGEMGQGMWSPQIEAFERKGEFIVRADLPGLNKDNVKVDITDDTLTIQGERKQEHEENREGYHRSERSYGSFCRTIPLPEGANTDEAKASFRDGVLEISMPAPQREERRRQIEIKS
jgi:HSP20 family protein